MAGLGRKVFNAGEVLSAANVQGYLQDQVVQVYSGTAARSSALGTAVSEGMTSYLTDSNELSVYTVNGTAAWSPVSMVQSPNVIINGGFDIWQRGTSFATTGALIYTADHFYNYWNGSGTTTVSQQAFTAGTAPVSGYEASFFYRYAQTVAGTGQTYAVLATAPIEDVRTLAGQTATFSFWAKADAARTYSLIIGQAFGTGGSTVVEITNDVALTTSWARYTITVNIASVAGKTIGAGSYLYARLQAKTFNITQTVDTWGWQLEAGSVATPFRRNAPSLQGELAACQRYYQRITPGVANGVIAQSGFIVNSTTAAVFIKYPVQMRTIPTSLDYSLLQIADQTDTTFVVSSASINAITTSDSICLLFTSSGMTSARFCYGRISNTGSGYLGFSAEL